MALTESTQRIASYRESAPDPMIMHIKVVANEEFFSHGINFELMMDVKMCQRIMRELRNAIGRLNILLSEINSFKLDHNLHNFMCEFRWRLNKYSIMRSDCYWQDKDEDLRNTMVLLEDCYNQITKKWEFNVGDLMYVIKVLETVIFNFEQKISELEEIF